jgi:hypothetical protein
VSPVVSKAQFGKMFILYKQGKITKSQLDDFTHGVNYKKLPERVKPKVKAVAKKRRKKKG